MSKSILVMDTPPCCGECKMSGTGVCMKWNRKNLRTFPRDCPLKEVPSKMPEESRWYSEEYAEGFNACIDDILKEADNSDDRTINDGWIPCSKRLPLIPEGENEKFIATTNGIDGSGVLNCDSHGTWYDDDGNIYDVIAWQMLPEPYVR